MKVLVTGHNGYIGSVMVPYLRDFDLDMVGLDTNYFNRAVNCTIPEITKDIRDILPEDLEGIDAVIHLAALSNDPMGALREKWTYNINYHASIRLAKAAKEAGVHTFLYSSSCSMYGTSGGKVLDESATLDPLTDYAKTKVLTEEGLSDLADDGFSPVFLRNGTAYGVSPQHRLDLVLNNLVAWAHTTGSIRIMSDGTPWRPIVHIEDISRAFLACLVAPRNRVHNQAFNVGANPENYQVRDLAEIVQALMPKCKIEYEEGGSGDPRSYQVSFNKIHKTLLTFRPKWTASKGVEELLTAYKGINLTEKDLVGKKYIRLNQLRHLRWTNQLDEDLRWRTR